jgi:hypothetical protein
MSVRTTSGRLGIIASLLMLTGYGLYGWYTVTGEIDPNATSWLLWALGGILEAWTYWRLLRSNQSADKREELGLLMPSIICACGAVAIASIGIVLGRFETPEPYEIAIAVLDILVILVWLTTKDDFKTNMLMQFDIAISFAPILIATHLDPSGEWWVPWAVWTPSYFVLLIAILKSKRQGRGEWVYPVVATLLHGSMLLLALGVGRF